MAQLPRLLQPVKTYQLPILSGLLIGTTYIPFFPWALVFCLAPLWIFWFRNRTSYKKLIIGSWLTQFILNIIGFHWVAYTVQEFGGFPAPLAYLVLLLFATAAHLYYPIAAVLWARCAKHISPGAAWVLIPVAFLLCETINPTIFFWHLGYPWLWIQLPGAHMAEWIGFYGLNIVTLAMNLLVVLFFIQRKKYFLVLAVALFAVTNGIGYGLKVRAEKNIANTETLRVLVVQANIGNAIKAEQEKGSNFHQYILRKFLELTDAGLRAGADTAGHSAQNTNSQTTDLIIWPETAFPDRARAGKYVGRLQDSLRYSLNTFGVPLLSGAYEQDDEMNIYNSLVLFDKKGQFVESYRKTYLLAFGEYFPFASYYPQLKVWFPMVSDFGRGRGAQVIHYSDTLKIGSQICYESLFDGFSRDLILAGSQVIVNVTNDSWFGHHAEPYQHGYMTLARAMEFRVPLVRSTNTGISTVIQADGTIEEQSPLHQEWFGHYDVKYAKTPPRTVYSYYAGYWALILFIAFFAVFIGGLVVRSRKH